MSVILLAPKPVHSFTAEDYIAYIRSLYVAPPQPKPYSCRLSPKGNPVVLCKRKPKFLHESEFIAICKELEVPQSVLFIYLKKREIAVRKTK